MGTDDEMIAAAMKEITRNLGEMVSATQRIVNEITHPPENVPESTGGNADQGDRASHHYDYHGIYFHR